MSLFGKTFDIEHLIEKAMEHIDMEAITADVMADLKITDLDLFFVVGKPVAGQSGYEFVGMAYSLGSARDLSQTHGNAEILKLDLMKLVPIAKEMGFVETVR